MNINNLGNSIIFIDLSHFTDPIDKRFLLEPELC
jgi:hypothetical protein